MVLEKHNKQQHSIKQKKENTTLSQIFSENSSMDSKTPANPDNVLFILCTSTHRT